jgi:spheroidene monooxygenase
LDLATEPPAGGPIAALTRASIQVRKASAFWNHAPPSQAALAGVPGIQLAVGLGEAPFLRQATFTVWDSVQHMDAYARSGAHLEAIKAAAEHQYFSESMFARFVPVSIEGRWKDRSYG